MAARSQLPPDPADALLADVASLVRAATGLDGAVSLALDEPLATLGLDSLALVNAVAAVETAFGRELPDSLWEDRRGISVASLAAAVAGSPRGAALAPPAPLVPAAAGEHAGVSRRERRCLQLEQHGPAGRAAAHVLHRAAIGAHWARSSWPCFVLERELGGVLPEIALPPGITVARDDGLSDAALAGMWPATETRRMRAHLRRDIQGGMHCLAAWEHGRIVAYDLIAPTGAEDVATRPGTCFGLGLYERRDSRGRGIGLALLAASLRSARELGFVRQARVVRERNRPMIAAATQMLGFAVAGRAERAERLGRVTWTWRRHGSICAGARLYV
jgi:GNAT superfamily N-acetyltransferase/acyl carrier protein